MGMFKVRNNAQQQNNNVKIQQRNQDMNEGYDRVRQQIEENDNDNDIDNGKTISEMQKQEQEQEQQAEPKTYPKPKPEQKFDINTEYIQKQPEPVQIQEPVQEQHENQLYSAKDVLKMLKADKEMQAKERMIMLRNVLNEILGENEK